MVDKFALSQVKQIALWHFDNFNESKEGANAWEAIKSMVGREEYSAAHTYIEKQLENAFSEQNNQEFESKYEAILLKNIKEFGHQEVKNIIDSYENIKNNR